MEKRPRCACGCLASKAGLSRKDGRQLYKPRCDTCQKKKYNQGRYAYVNLKGDFCAFCGFIPVHPCQLDVDHIDGNHKNNDPSNLMTLCSNCHRLKTHVNRDNIP